MDDVKGLKSAQIRIKSNLASEAATAQQLSQQMLNSATSSAQFLSLRCL